MALSRQGQPGLPSHRNAFRDSHRFLNLLVLHAVQTTHQRLWNFAVPVVFVALQGGEGSARPLAAFTGAVQTAKLLFLPLLGGFADRLPLAQVGAASSLGHGAVVACCLLFLVSDPSTTAAGMLVCAVLLGAAAEMLKDFSSIALEMRVAPALACEGDELARLNSLVRRVELFMKFAVPLAFGWYASLESSTATHLVGCVLTAHMATGCAAAFLWQLVLGQSGAEIPSTKQAHGELARGELAHSSSGWLSSLQPGGALVSGMSLAFAILFCSALTDADPMFTAHLASRGVLPGLLGTARSMGALTGLLGTWLWPLLQSKLGTLRGAAASLHLFAFTVGTTAFVLGSAPYAALLLLVLSRTFLWSFDLAMVSILQDFVPSNQRGRAAALQSVAGQVASFAVAALAVALPRFEVLAAVSACAVVAAAMLFTACALGHSSTMKPPFN